MTDSTGTLSETHSSSSANEPAETQLAQAGDQVQVSEPSIGTTIQLVAAGDSLQLGFDPADVAKAEVKDGNLEITFKSGAVAVVQGYEEWAAAGGQPTGPQGGAVDVAQLGQPAAPAVCELPGQNVHVVDVPVPADGERLTLAVAPGDALRLACSFRDVHGAEVGNNLEMTFPGGGVVVVENFSEWIAAKGSTISDCVCGGVNPADFIVALGLNPEDILPAAGGEGPGGPLPADSPSFAPGPGPEILHSFDHPHILPPTALGYGLPEPDKGLVDEDEENHDLGGPIASAPDPLRVVERTGPLQGGTLSFTLAGFENLTASAAADVDADGDCIPPTGPVQFVQDQASGQIFVNDDFGPDGKGNPPLFSLVFTGALLVDAIHGILQGDGHTLRITSLDVVRPGFIDVDILTGLATVHLIGAFDHGGKDDGANVALETFNYTIQDKDGDKSTTQVTIEIVDSVPVAHDDCEVCIVEPGRGTDGVNSVGGNVMLNDDLGADQFLPAGTDLIAFAYDSGAHTATVPDGGSATVTTAVGGTLTVHSNGDWTYTPPDTVDNSNGDVHDNFTYTIRDGDGDTSQAVQPICIQDGADPEAFDNKQCVNEGATQNVVIIADVSGSMDDDDLDPDPAVVVTRLDLEKLALAALVDKYATLAGTVTITLIAFSSGPVETAGGSDTDGALNLGTFTFASTSDPGYAAAIAAISSLAVGLGPLNTETEYDDALITAQNVLTAQLPGQPDGTTNTVYFLSDGEPNPASNDAGATGWKAFVDANHIEVVAIGMGDDIAGSASAIAELTEVEDDGDAPVIVNDKSDLAGLVTNNAGNASVSGNVLTDPTEEANISPANDPIGSVDKFGNDGAGSPKIISFVHDGHTYDLTDAVGGEGGTVLAKNGDELTIQTDLGGTLTFNFQTGDYTYIAPDKVQHGPPGSPTDTEVDEVFTYTIQDKDGDTDPANLVICIQDGVPTAADDVNLVQESALDLSKDGIDLVAGLVVGSNAASKAETVTGNLVGNDSEGPDGASTTAIKFNGSDVTDASDGKLDGFIDVNTGHSALHVNAATGEYVYTLFDKTSGDGVKDVFNYTLTDGDGDQAKANLTVTIVDDVPTANDDTDSIGAGGKATGNVITGAGTDSDGPGDDVKGADGATVTDVDFGATDGTPGVGIAGLFGTLILNADGSYEYQAKANVSGKDVFTYTLTDGDGDNDTATLTINVGASTPVVNPATDEVHEASLDTNKDGLDLVAGNVTGSNPADTDETETGKLVFSDPDGASITKITFNAVDTLAVGGFIDVDTGHGKLHVNAATGDYTYTLYDKTTGDTVHDDFGYTVKDTLGNTASSTLTVNVVDDVPTANDDKDSVGAGGKATGNVITGESTSTDGPGDDVKGADGATVTDIDFGATDGTPGVGIAGNFGTLILNANGSYEYQAKANVSGTDVFAYTLTDGDGDVDTATLTIDVGASSPVVNPATDEVHEASLDLNKDGLDLVAGKVTGSNPADTDETETGKLSFSDPDGASISKITFNAVDTSAVGGFIDVDTGHGKLHVNATTGDYTYTLYDKTAGDAQHDDFTYTVKDTLGNTNSSTLTVNIVDDVPHANNDSNTTADTQPQDINLVIVFDRSGSMADDPGAAGYSTRLELAKAAVAALFEAYESIAQDLHIKIVDFGTDANHTVWLNSAEEANAYLASLSPDGSTHYNDAIQELIGNYNTVGDPVPDADRTEVYFISDGKPNPASQSLSASGTVAAWQSFLTNNGVDKAFAIGVGTGILANDGDLEDVAFGQPSLVVTSESQLLATLVGTVTSAPLTGNVISDTVADVFGADGKGNGGVGLLSIQVGAVTYTYDKALDHITNNANAIVIAGAELIVTPVTLGGSLDFHFDTGDYTLTAANVVGTKNEDFLYTIIDGDGDKSQATLHLTVTDAGDNVVTPLTHIGTNGGDNFNDSAAVADIIMSGGDGNDTLTGGTHNDHIQGGDGNDLLNGNAGIDILIGGGGADTVSVGTGDVAESGETADSFGNDLIILKDNTGFGHVDGGFATDADLAGKDTRGDILAFDGTLDLTSLANSKIEGIETISMTEVQGGSGDSTDTLTLNAQDVIDLGTGHFNPSGSFNPTGPVDFGALADKDAIKVDGEVGDTVNLSGGGWFQVPTAGQGVPANYNLYVHDSGGGNEDAYVLVQNVVAVTGAS